jgi:hypothetical protein
MKGEIMSNNNDRVLNRMGARQLTQNEIDQIAAGEGPFTHASRTLTGPASNPDVGMDS